MKCPVNIDALVAKEQKYEIGKDIVDDRNIEVKKESVDFKTLYNCKCEDNDIDETINLGENDKPIGEILQANMQIVGKDYKTSYNKILAKAEAIIKIVYIADNENSSIETFEAKIPVMGFLDIDDLNDEMEVNLDYSIKCFNVKPVYQDLKATAISLNSEVEICAYVYKKMKFDIISDLYSTEKKLNCEYDAIKVLQNNVSANENIEIVQSLLIPELDMLNILNINANPTISEINVLDEKLALEGNIEFNILFYRNDKKVLENKKMELPFQQVVRIANLQTNMNPQIDLNVYEIEYKAIGGNQEQIRLNLNISVQNSEELDINSIRNIEIADEELGKIPSIIVYYVKGGDTLWDIAKKFRTTVEEIKSVNELIDDFIYPNQQLIIQKKKIMKQTELLL